MCIRDRCYIIYKSVSFILFEFKLLPFVQFIFRNLYTKQILFHFQKQKRLKCHNFVSPFDTVLKDGTIIFSISCALEVFCSTIIFQKHYDIIFNRNSLFKNVYPYTVLRTFASFS